MTEPLDPWKWGINLFLALLILLLPIGLLIFSLVRGRRRHQAVSGWARQVGHPYRQRGGVELGEQMEGFQICKSGSRRLVLHVVDLPEADAMVFDLLASDGSPRPGVGFHSQTVLMRTVDDVLGAAEPILSTTSLPGGARGHRAWIETRGRVAIYYIHDLLVKPAHWGRFIDEGLARINELGTSRRSPPSTSAGRLATDLPDEA